MLYSEGSYYCEGCRRVVLCRRSNVAWVIAAVVGICFLAVAGAGLASSPGRHVNSGLVLFASAVALVPAAAAGLIAYVQYRASVWRCQRCGGTKLLHPD